jgi:RNA polymerase sigma-70 factor (ECF subfamily)
MHDTPDRLYERVLVLRCQTGDESAFEELVRLYDRRLRYYVRKMLGADAEMDDTLQDLWLDVFRALPRLNDPTALPAWLYRLARDRVFRQLRGRSIEYEPVRETEVATTAPEDAGLSPEDVSRVHTALDALSPEHREVLVLRFLEAMSYEDIVAVTGLQIGTVRSRLHYAKLALRRALERMDDHG